MPFLTWRSRGRDRSGLQTELEHLRDELQRLSEIEDELCELKSREEELVAHLEGLMKWGDLTQCTGLETFREALKDSDLHPHEALETVKRSLDFMGNGASKWSTQTQRMHDMLLRVTDSGGQVRMLILDPSSVVCRDASKLQFAGDPNAMQRKIVDSLLRLQSLHAEYEALTIRIYDHAPNFRIAVIDSERAVVGHYRHYRHDSADTPLLVFREGPPWTFLGPFQHLFEQEWNRAYDVDWNAVNESATQLEVPR